MSIKRIKKKEGESLTDANIERVIGLIESEKPITKKVACEILNISYNTSRLNTIIEDFKNRKELDKKRRAALRGKPATEFEIKEVIADYLDGISISDIANNLYRPSAFVRRIIETVGVPQKVTGENYADFHPLPDQCVSESFESGEIAWSSRYQAACIIEKDLGLSKDGEAPIYRVFVIEPFEPPEKAYVRFSGTYGGFYASQPAYDLGRLDHLKKWVDLERKFKVNARTQAPISSGGN